MLTTKLNNNIDLIILYNKSDCLIVNKKINKIIVDIIINNISFIKKPTNLKDVLNLFFNKSIFLLYFITYGLIIT